MPSLDTRWLVKPDLCKREITCFSLNGDLHA
jgi:hypothetical protein